MTVQTETDDAKDSSGRDNCEPNQFIFGDDQLPLLENTLNQYNFLAFRIDGPAGPKNSLFTWDGGGLDLETGAHPVLRIVAEPGRFVVITNTPTAENVVTAATMALNMTAVAKSAGTPTPFPRLYATETPIVQVTAVPTPLNVQTRVSIAARGNSRCDYYRHLYANACQLACRDGNVHAVSYTHAASHSNQ